MAMGHGTEQISNNLAAANDLAAGTLQQQTIADQLNDNLGIQLVAQPTNGMQAMLMSLLVILVSEIGDKTFLIAALMAMRHSRILVFSAAISALLVMTVMSALLGQILPSLISKNYTEFLASTLFFGFGIKLLWDSRGLSGNECLEEMEAVQAELVANDEKKEDTNGNASTTAGGGGDSSMESGGGGGGESSTSKLLPAPYFLGSVRRRASRLISPVWIQVFIMTFIAEWGDRSQIATVALAGSQDFIYVTIGGLLGHAICSFVAVMGGKLLASRISVKTVTVAGALLFLIFGIIGFYNALNEYS